MANNSLTIILMYVYDIIIVGDNLEEIQNLKVTLHNHFKVRDLDILKYFLGIEIVGIEIVRTKLRRSKPMKICP